RRALGVRRSLSDSHEGQARAYDQLRKHAEADRSWDQAIELTVEHDRPRIRASRAKSRLLAGRTAEAMAEVMELTKLAGACALHGYNFACVCSVASTKVAGKEQEYADRAMELLRQAVKLGHKDTAYVKKDTELDPLRGREDFKKLVAELEARAKQPEKQDP